MIIVVWRLLLVYTDTTATHSPASDSANRRTNDTIVMARGDTPEIIDEILTTARDLELEVNEDIEEFIMGHEDELMIEELQEILNIKNTKKHNEMCLLLNERKTKEDQNRHLPLKIFLKSGMLSEQWS
ncbi:hypothetical protein TNCV_774161 [Trichonephila clavipes]|nr:hypothetical protein TNCV_774161 [Trichonephila clavipes]